MNKNKIVFSSLVAILLSQQLLHANDEKVELEKASVETEVYDESSIGSKSVVNAKTIQITSSAELLNPYKAISLEPGVDIRSNDPFGMSVTHKIRGKNNRNIGETLEGLPLKGIGPGGGLATLMDMENISSVSVEKGPIKADSGFGYGSDNGMVDMKIKKPSKEFSTEIKQAIGSYHFRKTYLRVDSGEMAEIAKVFASISLTNADKFKGSGKSPDRKNFAMGIASTSDQLVEWEVYGIYNDEKTHSYKGLNYEQSKNLSQFKNLDYQNHDRTKSDYYDNNRNDYQTYTLFAKLKAPLGNDNSLSFRPYFLNDKGNGYSAKGKNVQDWLVDHDTYGAVLEYEHNFDDAKIKLGYWYQEDEPPGPPTSRKLRKPNSYEFVEWERIVKVDKKHTFQTPFLAYEHTLGNTIIEAGLKYLWVTSPELTSYNTSGIGDVDYKTALGQVSAIDFSLPANSYEVFLPNLGVTHYLNDESYLKASYGRNYNTISYGFGGSMVNYFNTLKKPTGKFKMTQAQAQAKLQSMWADLKPEESDNFDLGYSYQDEKISFESTIFYSKVKNVGGTFYDPVLDYDYQQNTAEAQSYGLELGLGYQVLSNFLVKGAATYNRNAFTTDIQSGSNTVIATKGNQLPDVPFFYGNISAEYDLHGYTFAPIVRYLGKRYVDVTHNYDMDAHFLVDLSISKDFKIDQHKLSLSLACTNLFDKEYISTFSASEINIKPETTYTVGAPRTLFASLSYKY